LLATNNAILAEETAVAPATHDALAMMHAALDRFWVTADRVLLEPPDMRWRLEFATAVAEIGANIVRHAYRDGGGDNLICLRLCLYQSRAVACFADTGVAYISWEDGGRLAAEDAGDAGVSQLAEGGYGMAIARTALDRLQYRRTSGVNCWRLVKSWNIQMKR
jgi:serine/threonine-protein kinase RsbW